MTFHPDQPDRLYITDAQFGAVFTAKIPSDGHPNERRPYGYVPAIATPFNATGEIMEDAFVELFEFLIKRGATTICVVATTAKAGR